MRDLPAGFRRYVWSRLAGNTAMQVLLVALGWQVYDLTASAWDLGLVGLYQFLPALLLAVPSGQLADRFDRRTILAASQALQLAVAGALAWGSGQGWITREVIFILSVALGAARALQMPAQQALVPTLVPREDLPRAFAMSSLMMKISTIGGPALGGFLYAVGPVAAYGASAGFLLLSLVLVAAIERAPPREVLEPISLASLFAGFGYIWRHKVILGAISLDLFAVVLGAATALLPVFAKDVLQTGPWGLGLLRAAPAIGGLVTAAWVARTPIDRNAGRIMFATVAVYGAATLVFAFSTSFVLSFLMLGLGGAADMVSVVIRQSLVQLDTPDEMRGRVSAVNVTFIQASNQLGDFRAGVTAEWLGPVGAVVLGAAGTLAVVGLWMKLFPALLRRERLAASP